MSNPNSPKSMQLSIVYSHEVWRKNEKDGSEYVVMFYRIPKEDNSPDAIQQYCDDTVAANYKVVYDDVTGDVMFRTTRPVAEGCNVVRSHSGKWYPDMSKLRNMQALSQAFGKEAVVDSLLRNVLGTNQTTHEPEQPVKDSIDPFA